MKIYIPTRELTLALKNINNLINNNTNPILKCVHMKTCKNCLLLTATDGTSSYQQKINNITNNRDGEILINANLLYNLVSKINNEKILFEQIEEKILQIKANNFSCEINLFDVLGFPIFSFEYENYKSIVILKKDIDSVREKILPFAAKGFISQYSVNGILFNPIAENEIECVATDSYRIAYFKFKYSGEQIRFIIEPNIINLICQVSEDLKCENIELNFLNNICIAKINDVCIKFTLCANNFPNIIDKILSNQNYQFTLNSIELYNALIRGASLVASEIRPIVSLKIIDQKLNIDFISSGIGHSIDEINISESAIKNFNTKLNFKLFVEIIRKINSQSLTISFNNSNDVLIITSNDQLFKYLILPSL